MKKITCLVLFMATVFSLSAREQGPRPNEHNMQPRRPGKIALPVYAQKSADEKQPELTPAERERLDAARKRRFAIMVLISAYKIMPEDQRQALKAELLKRIEDDFNATVKQQKEQIIQAEAELKKLRAELAEKEANSAKLIASELERLLKMPMPGRRIPRPNKDNHKKPAGR